mmetsp:Transcript_85106/g.156088  ORF Transcript_85106/g.156088 Transcript_85106/m.156088 type:complete len:148 (-) Transcript_85106:159-602(-)
MAQIPPTGKIAELATLSGLLLRPKNSRGIRSSPWMMWQKNAKPAATSQTAGSAPRRASLVSAEADFGLGCALLLRPGPGRTRSEACEAAASLGFRQSIVKAPTVKRQTHIILARNLHEKLSKSTPNRQRATMEPVREPSPFTDIANA